MNPFGDLQVRMREVIQMHFHENRMLAIMELSLASLFCIGCAKLFVKQEFVRADEGLNKSIINLGWMYTIPEKRDIRKIVIIGWGTVRNLEIHACIEEYHWKPIKKIKKKVTFPIEIHTMVRTDAIRIFQLTVAGRGGIDTIELYTTRDVIEGAEVARKEAISINPNLAQMHYNLGVTYDAKGMRNEAIAEYKKAISANPNFAEAHYNLGIAYDAKGMLDDAITEYEKAVSICPDLTEAHYNLGICYYNKGKLDDAIQEYQAAIRIEPDHARAHVNLGKVYKDKGKLDDAIMEFQNAIVINPDLAETYVHLGNVYVATGDSEKAILLFQKFIALAKNHHRLQQLIPQVENLIRQLQGE